MRIVDEDDWPVPTGTVGEIVARGRVPWATALGYQNMPDKTVELVRNHFYHTGDAGCLDEEGYLFFRDRIKDYIRRRGENISSAEIERVVNSHPSVAESAAISVKSELSEDEVKVVVILKPGQGVAAGDIARLLRREDALFRGAPVRRVRGQLSQDGERKGAKGKAQGGGHYPCHLGQGEGRLQGEEIGKYVRRKYVRKCGARKRRLIR